MQTLKGPFKNEVQPVVPTSCGGHKTNKEFVYRTTLTYQGMCFAFMNWKFATCSWSIYGHVLIVN